MPERLAKMLSETNQKTSETGVFSLSSRAASAPKAKNNIWHWEVVRLFTIRHVLHWRLRPVSDLSGANHRSAQVLVLLVIPGHLIFLYTIHLMKSGHTTLTPIFMSVYLAAAMLQVSLGGPVSCPKTECSSTTNTLFHYWMYLLQHSLWQHLLSECRLTSTYLLLSENRSIMEQHKQSEVDCFLCSIRT